MGCYCNFIGYVTRGQPNFGFGPEIGKKFSFGMVLFLVGHAVASFGFG